MLPPDKSPAASPDKPSPEAEARGSIVMPGMRKGPDGRPGYEHVQEQLRAATQEALRTRSAD